MKFVVSLILTTLLFTTSTGAEDSALVESEARNIFHELRCVTCAGQSVAESDAEIAQEMRRYVREQLKQGKTSEQILDYITHQYGDEVLMKPPLNASTFALWFGPPIFLFLGIAIALAYFAAGRIQKKT